MSFFNTGKAMRGASIGSAFGAIGAIAGGVHGGINDKLPSGLRKVLDPIGLHSGGMDGNASNEFRDVSPIRGDAAAQLQRGKMLQRLQLQAAGQGPSLTNMQAAAALQQGRAQLESMAASDRRNPALARRNAMLQGGNLSARIGQQAMMGRLAEQQQAEQALAQAIYNAQQIDNQRADIYERARTERFKSLLGTPTSEQVGMGALAQTLPMIGQMRQSGAGGSTTTPPAQVGSQAHSTGMAYGLGEQGDFQHPNAPQGTWVPTGPYGQGYYK